MAMKRGERERERGRHADMQTYRQTDIQTYTLDKNGSFE